ncbi:hypothetical protein [Cryptosporangium japonicum]
MGAKPAFAPPVPRRSHTVLIVSLVVGAVLLVCGGGGVTVVGGLFYVTYDNAQNSAVDAVETYLGDLRDGRYQQAYGRLCLEARSDRSLDEFTQAEQTAGQVVSYTIEDRVGNDQDGNWVLTAQVSRQGNPPRSELFPVTFATGNTAQVCP